MFGWFTTKCPLDTWEKTWTETRMCWLAQKLGIGRLTAAEVVLPTERHFPASYQGSLSDVQAMMWRVCGFMGIPTHTVDVEVCPDEVMPGAAGSYQQRQTAGEKSLIRIASSQLSAPMALVATLTHELAHEILLGGEILDQSVIDHEWITDLLQVYLGVGIFAANTTVYDRTMQNGQYSSWVIGKQGYLPSRMYGYALALFAWVRGEKKPAWTTHLRRDARTAFDQGLRYLESTRDSLFRPEMIHAVEPRLSGPVAIGRLRGGTATVRLATLWEMDLQGLVAPECLGVVADCLHHPDAAVAGEAARQLARFGAEARSTVPTLMACLRNKSDRVRAEAAYALGELGGAEEAVAWAVASLLQDEESSVVVACAEALARLGVRLADPFPNDLLARLEAALIACDHPPIVALAMAVRATLDKPKRRIRDYFEGKDKELRRLALQAVEELRDEPDA